MVSNGTVSSVAQHIRRSCEALLAYFGSGLCNIYYVE